MLIPESYREIGRTKGRSLQEIHSSGVAFARVDAFEALEFLKGTHVGVSGGDVLRVVDGKLRYTYDSWHTDKRLGEGIWEYLARSIAETESYIRNYPDPEDGTILYSPVISELGL